VDLQLTGKKAIVTGASRGIGPAIARQLALDGYDIAICARTEEPLKDAAPALAKQSGRKVVPVVCDTRPPNRSSASSTRRRSSSAASTL
jgi:3-oxoacyl-[acyl-carrier protein] reductase